MTRVWMGLALGSGMLAACGGTPPFGGAATEPDADTSDGSVYLTEANTDLTLNNISYDANSDTLSLNNIPFDDPDNTYIRLPGTAFVNGFSAYESSPAPGSQEIQYFAVFRRSDSGASQVAAAATDVYVDFGFAGAGAQRLSGGTGLPRNGIYTYSGEYAGVRTINTADNIQFVTGDLQMRADFGDFDDVGAVSGEITNRELYDEAGQPLGAGDPNQLAAGSFITLANGEIDFTNGTIDSSTAQERGDSGGIRSGNWQGVFAGAGGNEIAGVVFVEGDDIREVGGLIATCVGAVCP